MLSDHELGQRLGRLLAQLQDLLGAETSLASPLRDLLLRPAFRELIDSTTTARAQRQQHLLQDLRHTYSAAVVQRLEAVLHGCLGNPPAAAGAQQPPQPAVRCRWRMQSRALPRVLSRSRHPHQRLRRAPWPMAIQPSRPPAVLQRRQRTSLPGP